MQDLSSPEMQGLARIGLSCSPQQTRMWRFWAVFPFQLSFQTKTWGMVEAVAVFSVLTEMAVGDLG